MKHTAPEVICAGEYLLDLISTEYAADFRAADTYRRIPGGSPANLAMNLAKLGRRVRLVATVGQDDAGQLLINAARGAGVDTTHVYRVAEPTTLILVTKSKAVSNFEPYRGADRFITTDQVRGAVVAGVTKVLHTTAFALSMAPARRALLDACRYFSDRGVRPSVDFNYAAKIWGDDAKDGGEAAGAMVESKGAMEAGDASAIPEERGGSRDAMKVLKELCELGTLLKMSDVDYERVFGAPVTDPRTAARKLLAWGAHAICLTLGPAGCYVLTADADFALPARPVDVVDTTGAGDAFWSGFLAAYLAGYTWKDCARAGRGMAERKLVRVGPVTDRVNLQDLITN